jgi:hypothetical protein
MRMSEVRGKEDEEGRMRMSEVRKRMKKGG